MTTRRTFNVCARTLAVLALVLSAGEAGGQTPATWDGSTGDTLYGTADNWDIATVPLDAGLDTYQAIIPSGHSVYFAVSGTTNQVTGLDLAYGSTLVIQPTCQLTVSGQASIGGYVTTLGGDTGGPLGLDRADGHPGRAGGLRRRADRPRRRPLLLHGAASTFSVTAGAAIRLAGNFSFDYTDEALLNGDAALVQLDGAGVQCLEVGGADLGVDGATSGNFGLAQLTVGTDTDPVTAFVVDLVDNGNRASPEALYLYGSGGLDGLELLGGSTLYVGNINVYTLADGVMVHINDLFAGGQRIVAFDEGFVGNPILGDANLDDQVGIADNYGAHAGATVPEPAVTFMLIAGAAATRRRRRR